MAPPSSPIISQMVADGLTPAMYIRAVQSSVCPLLSTRILSVVFRRCTCPGALNLSPMSLRMSSTGASMKMVSAYWVMVRARSSSVMPV